ncbi:phage N-6-adenine-methyltransferase [Thalassotalea loyana]|uniref:Phage N-6-adenine-methyltransferase n=1 Tax=Thalassotalea loyana TaxID=280483 RepID=A0ABQ6HDY4_9GAMM|nr:phage N-6-adenine-methyltransferase [Thalassotalea loyana]GLX85096.1 phage N-6-adenine-methyltransferase [Thalassotalea loyana]
MTTSKDYGGSNTPVDIRDLWATPSWLFEKLHQEFNFSLDAAARKESAKVDNFITKEENALTINWLSRIGSNNRAVWINPPYSDIAPWLAKAEAEARKNNIVSVLLIPATPDAGWWPKSASEVRFITGEVLEGKQRNASGRIHFVRADTGEVQKGNPKGSALIVFAPGTLGNMTTKYTPITAFKGE